MTAQEIADAYLHSAWAQDDRRLEKAKRTAARYDIPWEAVQPLIDAKKPDA